MDELEELALLIKARQRELERRTNEAMAPLGLTAAQADALHVIALAGPLTLKDLGKVLIAEAGHPSRLVERLVERKLVERRPVDDDRRRAELTVTAQGARVHRDVEKARQDLFKLARALLGDRDVTGAVALLRDLNEHSSFAELLAQRRRLAGS